MPPAIDVPHPLIYPQHIVTDFSEGKPVKGIFRDPKHGRPIGSSVKERVCARGTTLKQTLNSDDAVRGKAQVLELWHALRGKLNVKVSQSESSGINLRLTDRAAVRSGDDDDDNELLDWLWEDSVVPLEAAPKAP